GPTHRHQRTRSHQTDLRSDPQRLILQEATYNRVSAYKHVSYYLVRKHNNVLSVLTCARNRRNAPSLKENYSPVTNAYPLWQEYKEVSSSTTLLNVMRRILEHYFLQLCGHDGVKLR